MAAKPNPFTKLGAPARAGIGIGIVAVVAALYYALGFTDVADKVTRSRNQQATLRKDLASQQEAQSSYFADRDELALLQQKQRDISKILPEQTDMPSFLSAVQTVSNLSGVDLKAWAPQPETADAFFARVPMRLELTGRFHQVVKFAYELGRQDRIINVEGIEISDPKQSAEDVRVRAKLTAIAFHLTAAKPPAGGK